MFRTCRIVIVAVGIIRGIVLVGRGSVVIVRRARIMVVVILAVSWVANMRVFDLIGWVLNLRDLVLAAVFVNTDFMAPTGLHPAIILVAEGFLLESDDAGAWWLEHSWAFVEAGRTIVVITLAWLVGLCTPVWSLCFMLLISFTTAFTASLSTIARFTVFMKSVSTRLGQESIDLLDSSNHLLVFKLDCHAYRDEQACH